MLLYRPYVIATLKAYLRAPRKKILTDCAAIRAGRRPLARYGFAIAMVVLGWLAREGLSSAVGPTALPYVFLFPAVAMTCWFGGLGPGLLATVSGAAAAEWFFVAPLESLAIQSAANLAGLTAFLVSCLFVIVAVESMHRARAGALAEVAERAKAEERLARFAAIVEYSRDAVVSKSLDGIVTSWNPGAESLFGYSATEMIGTSITRIIPPELAEEEHEILSRLREGQSIHHETIRLTRDGRRVPVSVTISPIRDRSGEIVGGAKIARDISEQKATEEELRATQRQLLSHAAHLEATVAERTAELQETVNQLQAFSYSIAHDMRAPLRAMGTFAELLLEECSSLSSDGENYARRIVVGAKRMDSLIRDALNYAKATLEEATLKPVNLSEFVGGLIDTYPDLDAGTADIRIEGPLPVVLGNESLLTQCFANLLGNGVKFVAPGTRPLLCVSAETDDGVARVWIRDNGIGIPRHAQPRLFGMFQKLDSQYEGTGMGLAICRKAVERMGGKIGVESAPGEGSRFWVELRLAKDEA